MTQPEHLSPGPSDAARIWALIPCAGTGSRAATDGPKQYQLIAGQPVVIHTLTAFSGVSRLAGTLVVLAAGDHFLEAYRAQLAPSVILAAHGGATRAASVRNGLRHLLGQFARERDWVLVHDAARCLVTPEQIDALIDACEHDAVGGLLALPLPDTLKAAGDGRVLATVPRADKWLAQTPQMFRAGVLLRALEQAGDAVTDEASAMEAAGHQPLLVRGSAQNFKLTYPQDFALAQAVLASRRPVQPRRADYDYP